MGAFSNGTMGEDYRANWCEQCVHDGTGEGPYCPVWALHLDWNTDSCRWGWDTTTDPAVKADSLAKEAALDHFIPRVGVCWNGGCRMFVAKEEEWRGREDELRKLWNDRIIEADKRVATKEAT